MRTFCILAVTLAATLLSTLAKHHYGLCPPVDSNVKQKQFNVTKSMGIWYEYLVTPDLKEGHVYDCESWLMLQDNKTDTAFTVILNRQNQATNDTQIKAFIMDCEPTQYYTNTAVCYYQLDQPKNYLENFTSHRQRSFRIIYTDYYGYMIVSVCQSYGLFYYQDYLVLVRDKQPSLYHRKQMREKLLEIGLTNKDFDKGQSYECWGEDYFMP